MSVNEQLNSVRLLLEAEKAQDARNAFQHIDAEETTAYYLLKGKIDQKFQNWGEAINAFNKVLELDPDNAEANNNLHLIQNILNFWNPEMFNP
uniref:tetratricopeptide repeat protein n=1 Tax=uncultured Draconibacterium sp. TaxID=1573823 RepID=UPI003217D4F5